MQDILACIASIDENMGRVLDYLDKNDLAENTLVVYTSDQGFYMGENGWFDKRFMYDQSMQIPLLMRWPGKIKASSTNATLVQNIDFAPSFLDAAGVKIPGFMQGLSLKPLMLQTKTTLPRNELYYRFYEYYADHTVLPHLGIRTNNYKLIYFYTVDEWELYDLKKDPDEIKNVYSKNEYQLIASRLKKQLEKIKRKYADGDAAGSLK